jgi:NAD(P)-dependent dehydrogenase (short-subunit alcohol dehydrogenase family)
MFCAFRTGSTELFHAMPQPLTCAGKEAFARVLAAELAPRNIRGMCIRPHTIADAPAAGSYTNDLSKVRDGGSLTFTAGTGGGAHEISASYVANLGIRALVQGLAAELAPRVRVNAVAPTFMGTATTFWRDMVATDLEAAQAAFAERVPLKRPGTVEEVASAYVHLMTNGFITGQVLAVDGGVMLRETSSGV